MFMKRAGFRKANHLSEVFHSPKYRSTEQAYTSLDGFLKWLPQNIDSVELLHDFNAETVLQNIQNYKNTHIREGK